jgi:hypothetical protein
MNLKLNRIAWMMTISLVLIFASTGFAFQVHFLPDTLQVTSLSEFNVNLNIKQNNDGFRGYKVYVNFDPTLVRFIRAQKGALISGFSNYWWTVVPENPGVVRVECIVLGAGLSINNSGTILNLTFQGLKDGVQDMQIEKVEFYEAKTGAIMPNIAVKSGMVIVNRAQLPVLTQPTVQLVKAQSAVLGGNILVAGGSAITERGVVWSLDDVPTISDAFGKKISAGTTGEFSVSIDGLTPSTTYCFRIYAKSARGTAYSNIATFTTTALVLPVELATFSANLQNGVVSLNWKTLSESNNYGFEIERALSQASAAWENIGFVAGHGNANSIHAYTFVDESPRAGAAQYRLRQIDTDGSFAYSEIVTVTGTPATGRLLQNFPNPFNARTTIQYQIPADAFVKLSLYNIAGQLLETLVAGEQTAGVHELHVDAGNWASGMYLYKIEAGTYSETRRLTVVK